MRAPLDTRLADLIDAFDVFFVDQFGVLHDGQRPVDGAVAALRAIRTGGKRIVLLSNSGKRTAPNAKRLHGLGFPEDSYDRLLTSGEVAWHMLASRSLSIPQPSERPLRCLLFMRGDDRSSVSGLGYDLVDDGGDADLVLIGGSEGDRLTLAEYRQRLRPAAERHVPALCTNPDKVMLTTSGPCFGAGRIGELYEELGGHVTWIGKPFPDIYRVAMEGIGATPADPILCIGDSVEHDIAGARDTGLKSALVTGTGILADLSEADLADVYAASAATPDFVIPAFSLT